MAESTWQTATYDSFLADKDNISQSVSEDEDVSDYDSDQGSVDQEYIEIGYNGDPDPNTYATHNDNYARSLHPYSIRRNSKLYEEFSEEITSFSAVEPHTHETVTVEEPKNPYEELTKVTIKSSSTPSGSPLHSAGTIKAKSADDLPTLTKLKRSDTAPQLRNLSKDSASYKGSLSVTSDRSSRLDPHTYQSYAAGILYSSGKSEKFLKLQKHFAVLGRISELDEKKKQRKEEPKLNECATSFVNSEEIVELYSELAEAQTKKEFFFNTRDMSDVQWRREKDRDLQKAVGLKERLDSYHNAVKVSEDMVPSYMKEPVSVSSNMKRGVSFGELYTIYDGNKNKSIKHERDLSSSVGSPDKHFPVQQSYIEIMEKASKPKQLVLYGSDINPRENPYERHVKANVGTLRRTFNQEPIKYSSSSPDISRSSSKPSIISRFSYESKSLALKPFNSTPDLLDRRQTSNCEKSMSSSDNEDEQFVASSLETLPSYNDTHKHRDLGNDTHKHRDLGNDTHKRRDLGNSTFSSRLYSKSNQYLTHQEIQEVGRSCLGKSDSNATDVTAVEVPTPYEINVKDLRVNQLSEEEGLHVRSSSAPHEAGSLSLAPTQGILTRSSSSKDTFFGAEFTLSENGTENELETRARPLEANNITGGSGKLSKKVSSKMECTPDYGTGFNRITLTDSPGPLLTDKAKSLRDLLPSVDKDQATNPDLNQTNPGDSDAGSLGDKRYHRTQTKDIYTKHLESSQPRKYSQGDGFENRVNASKDGAYPYSRQTFNPKDDSSSLHPGQKAHNTRSRLLSDHSDTGSSSPATLKYTAPNISQYEELLTRARRERMARKGYLHSYVNDPASVGFQPYTSIILTDTDLRFRNAYPSDLDQSLTSRNNESSNRDVVKPRVESLLYEYPSLASPNTESLASPNTHWDDPFSPNEQNRSSNNLYSATSTVITGDDSKQTSTKGDLTTSRGPLYTYGGSRDVGQLQSTYLTSQEVEVIGNTLKTISSVKPVLKSKPEDDFKEESPKENIPDVVRIDMKELERRPSTDIIAWASKDTIERASKEGPTVYNADVYKARAIHLKSTDVYIAPDIHTKSAGAKSEKIPFKVTDLRGLAQNNEFANKSLPRMKIPDGVGDLIEQVKPVPQPRIVQPQSQLSDSSFSERQRDSPPKPLPRKYSTSSPNHSEDETFGEISSQVKLFPNQNSNITISTTKNLHSQIPHTSHTTLRNFSSDITGVSDKSYGQLRKWTGISNISYEKDPDSSPSPGSSSDGSTGTFIVNPIEYEKSLALKAKFEKTTTKYGVSKSTRVKNWVTEGNSHSGQGAAKNHAKTYNSPQSEQNKKSHLNSSYSQSLNSQKKSKPSVSELKNVFEQQAQDGVKPLSRATSAPNLSVPDTTSNKPTGVSVKTLPRTVSGNLADIRKQFEEQDRDNQKQANNLQSKSFDRNLNSKALAQSVYSHRQLSDRVSDKPVSAILAGMNRVHEKDLLTEVTPRPQYDPYIPPDHIYKEVEAVREDRKLDASHKTPRNPSSVSKMTLEYFDHIGTEWRTGGVRRGRNSNFDVQGSNPSHSSTKSNTSDPKKAADQGNSHTNGLYENYQTDDMKLRQGQMDAKSYPPPKYFKQDMETNENHPRPSKPHPYNSLFPETQVSNNNSRREPLKSENKLAPKSSASFIESNKWKAVPESRNVATDNSPDSNPMLRVHSVKFPVSRNSSSQLQASVDSEPKSRSRGVAHGNHQGEPREHGPRFEHKVESKSETKISAQDRGPQLEKIPGKTQLVSVWVHQQDFRHQTSDVVRKSLPVDEKEKRRKEEDVAYRKKRLEELYEEDRKKRMQLDAEKESARKHHDFFIPSQKSPISPSRFEEVPDQSRQTLSPPQQRSPNPQTSKLTTTLSVPPERRRGFQIQGKAKALFNFTAQNPRELSFRKGDTLYLLRQIDKNWFEGEHHGQAGIFPVNYVEVMTSIEAARLAAMDAEGQGRARYNFTGQSSVELSLRKGEFVTLLRRVDDNWLEGRVGGRQGIFPVAYVEIIREPSTPLITPAPSVITTPMAGTPEMLSPVSMEAPTPPPQPSPSAFAQRSPGTQAYGYKQPPGLNRFQYDSQSPADLKSPEFTVYGQKGVLSPQAARRGFGGTLDRSRPSETISAPPVPNLNFEVSSIAANKPRSNKVADDDLALQRYRAVYTYRPTSEDELELKEGDEVFVMEKCDDGWFVGTSARTGQFGTFPGNYVQKQ